MFIRSASLAAMVLIVSLAPVATQPGPRDQKSKLEAEVSQLRDQVKEMHAKLDKINESKKAANDGKPRRKTAAAAVFERVKDAVVNIELERGFVPGLSVGTVPSMKGFGTGIVIDPRGYIVTNSHVVEDTVALRAVLWNNAVFEAVDIARRPDLDLAILRIDAPTPLPIMPIGVSADLLIGETAIAIGYGYRLKHSVSAGIISALNRDVEIKTDLTYHKMIQTDASINPGNSGGPLINVRGELIGVNTALRAGAHGIGFAIPVDDMVVSVADMLEKRRPTITGFTYSDQFSPGADGLIRTTVVASVAEDGPAQKAGLQKGDVLLCVGAVAIASAIDVERGLLDLLADEPAPLTIRRRDQEMKLKLILAAKEEGAAAPAKVKVIVPDAQAVVLFDGAKTTSTGTTRTFDTPPLAINGVYHYRIRATWIQAGKKVTEERRVRARPGETTVLDFTPRVGPTTEINPPPFGN